MSSVTHRYAIWHSPPATDQSCVEGWRHVVTRFAGDGVVAAPIRVLTPAPCWACPPHGVQRPALVAVDYVNRFGRWQRRQVCGSCLGEFLHWITGGESCEVLVYGPGAR
jgi:hypothetical protein